MSELTSEVLRIIQIMRRECCIEESETESASKLMIQFHCFNLQQEESKKKRKREDLDEKMVNSLIGLISVRVREDNLKETWSSALSSLSEELKKGRLIITHNSSLLNDLPIHSELIHNELVESLFIEENCLSFHCLVERERDLDICRVELRALSGYSQEFQINDSIWSSGVSNIACVKPEIKKTTIGGFISVERNQSENDNILDREGSKNKIKIWLTFLKNGQLISPKDAITLLDYVSAKDRWCDLRIDNQENTITMKENSSNETSENRKLFQMLFFNTEKYGIKFTNLTTIQESQL